MVLSTSPTSTVLAYDTGSDISTSKHSTNQTPNEDASSISLKEFTESLPPLLRRLKSIERNSLQGRIQIEHQRGTTEDPVTQLFSRLNLTEATFRNYALSNTSKNYTRNLVSTDQETYTLLLLCWNPGKQSPIHDHPCDGCWVRVCEGEVRETRYEKKEDALCVTSVETFRDNKAVSYINDYMGYHKVENPSPTTPAITLHLYCPPFDKCKIWLDPKDASRTSRVCMCNYSEYGDEHACDYFAVNMI